MEIRNPKISKIIKIVETLADKKINQGVLLKELAHSIRRNHKDKKPKEWKLWIFDKLKPKLEEELKFIEDNEDN